MDIKEIPKLFNSMKSAFNCEKVTLYTYPDPCSVVDWALSEDIEEFLKREERRKKVACIYNNKVMLNLDVARKIPLENVEKILIHEITHYLLFPNRTAEHPQFFWDEFEKNCKIWKSKKGKI